ncbi:MAG: DUF3450 family protein [Myxococcales bacterium]|nr:DUF3450 family protein [Myxococcales bacterium]
MRTLLPALCALAALTGVRPASAQDASGLAGALVALRAEVEQLTDTLEDHKRTARERRRALAAQKAQLEGELQREELRVRQLREARDRKRAEVARAAADDEALRPVVADAAAMLTAHVDRSIPFRRDERRAAVTEITGNLADGLLTPRTALARLWALVEDELRLTRDTGLHRETITLGGVPTMVDVVRIGTVGLYFRTGEDRVGTVARVGGDWQTTRLDDEAERAQVLALFDAFKKQIRVGWFELPDILPRPREAR